MTNARMIVLFALLATEAAWSQELTVECWDGAPYAVAYCEVPLARDEPLPQVAGGQTRVLLPIVTRHRRGVLRYRGESARIWLLIRGGDPLTLRLQGRRERSLRLAPAPPRRNEHGKLLTAWWEQFSEDARSRIQSGDHAPLVELYVATTVARRLKFPLPVLEKTSRQQRREDNKPLETLELIAGPERLRTRLFREALTATPGPVQPQLLPVPQTAPWQEPPEAALPDNVPVEPIANMVSPACFYVRFGRFSNFLWLIHLLREQGGDLGGMVTSRALAQNVDQRIEQQFALRYSVLADLFGDQVVADMALVGRDLYLDDGPTLGVLLQASNPLLLGAALARERSAALSRESAAGATRSVVEIRGRKVELVSTPDNRLRSFLAAHENYRLVTNSRHLVELFYETADGGPSLAATNEFLRARAALPLSRQDTLFAYFSTQFFHGLVTPQYQVELRRRLRSLADLQLLQLARAAASQEQRPTDVPSLVAAELLPASAVRRADGSRLAEQPAGSGVWVDSLRGARGTFLPIADVPLTGVTAEEASEYAALAGYYASQWQSMDALVAGVRRYAVPDKPGRERIVFEAQVTPFVEKKYGVWLSLLGEPSQVRFAAPPAALLTAQASIRGGLMMPDVPPHHMFGAVLDRRPDIDTLDVERLLAKLRLVQRIPGYLGTWPRPGFLDGLPLSPHRQEDASGVARLPLNLLRWRGGDYSLLAFDKNWLSDGMAALFDGQPSPPPPELDSSLPPAQLRLQIRDLTGTQLAPWLREINYQRAVAVSQGNALLLDSITRLLGVPHEDAMSFAERLLDADLQCPLDGDYACPAGRWSATAARPGPPPDTFQSPLLTWFRGAALMVNRTPSQLNVQGELEIQRDENKQLDLPLFNIPSLFFSQPKEKAGPGGK